MLWHTAETKLNKPMVNCYRGEGFRWHLREMIEMLRTDLVDLGMRLGLQDPAVLEASQNLDELIVLYYKLNDLAILDGR